MTRLLAAVFLVAIGLAGRAEAVGTMTSCTPLADTALASGYLHVARCAMSGAYAAGGDQFADVGRDVCGSHNRLPVAVSVSGFRASAGDATKANGFSYNLTTNKVQMWVSNGAAPALFTENAVADVHLETIVLLAFCR